MKHSHLKRLERIWIKDPIFFITTNTARRRHILTQPANARILIDEWRQAYKRHDWAIGRYVVMPDHVHFFCTPVHDEKSLSEFMMAWKQWTSKRIFRECGIRPPIWQPEFFDYLLRNEDGYEERYDYMQQNPVRANLVKSWEEWPWQGEIQKLL
jgi:putative transposase